MTELARVTTLEDLMVITTKYRVSARISQLVLDEISGLQEGYTAKLECGMKGLGKLSMPLRLQGLGLELVVVRARSTHRDENALLREFFSARAKGAANARWAKTSPKQRKKIARAAAKARWRKAERERT